MTKHKIAAGGFVAFILLAAGTVVADVGVGSWRLAIFDGEGYVNTALNQHATTTDELLGGGLGDDGPAWYSFDSTQFSVSPTTVSGVSGGFHRKITLISPSYTHIEGLAENYTSTSTHAELVSQVSTLNSDISSLTSQINSLSNQLSNLNQMVQEMASTTP